MNYLDITIKQFVDELSSKSPTPGGGGAAALSSALAAALGEMVVAITKNKNSDPILDQFAIEFKQFEQENLISINEDAQSFLALLDAFKMRPETEKEKQLKQHLLALNSLKAANIPLQVLGTSVLILEVLDRLFPYVSSTLLTDIGVAAQLSLASINSSYMNILVNRDGIQDKEFINTIDNTVPYLVDTGTDLANSLTKRVMEAILN